MKLTNNEARHLIEYLSECVFYGEPLHPETMLEAGILAKLAEAYPAETESVREQQAVERLRQQEENRKRLMEDNE